MFSQSLYNGNRVLSLHHKKEMKMDINTMSETTEGYSSLLFHQNPIFFRWRKNLHQQLTWYSMGWVCLIFYFLNLRDCPLLGTIFFICLSMINKILLLIHEINVLSRPKQYCINLYWGSIVVHFLVFWKYRTIGSQISRQHVIVWKDQAKASWWIYASW